MESPKDIPMKDNGQLHEPFTVEENIHQLNAIDKTIVQLMHHTGNALNALAVPSVSSSSGAIKAGSSSSDPKSQLDPPAQKEAFHSATDSFLDALHSVDVRMKRQIMALEEAGIVNLAPVVIPPANPQLPKAVSTVRTSMKPNGMGAVGNLDVGWLNSRGNQVEKDMEAEIWGKARELLTKSSDSANKN